MKDKLRENIWFCKIGGTIPPLPYGADLPMRDAIERAFKELTGFDAEFTFSGWGQQLTEGERAVVDRHAPGEEGSLP